MTHQEYMRIAISYAQQAQEQNEVPIGAIIVHNDEIIGIGYNQKETQQNPLLHAEIIAINQACQKLNTWRLTGATMYVTLEPCPMCAGAILQARISTLIFGARDAKAGACGSIFNICDNPQLNHRTKIIDGILETECTELLRQFFRLRREQIKKKKKEIKNV